MCVCVLLVLVTVIERERERERGGGGESQVALHAMNSIASSQPVCTTRQHYDLVTGPKVHTSNLFGWTSIWEMMTTSSCPVNRAGFSK